ncbi:oplophorus-luciferin 2-monooxygenase non-catalytic subunit-like [Panulirus ornatus]|uniref:oplophorus-luciferin 2-monooxygenase non-catalytic subunit-like n=1 Tax=Panulirus ornatus TaxID=150431 RepID=UPI003A86E58F
MVVEVGHSRHQHLHQHPHPFVDIPARTLLTTTVHGTGHHPPPLTHLHHLIININLDIVQKTHQNPKKITKCVMKACVVVVVWVFVGVGGASEWPQVTGGDGWGGQERMPWSESGRWSGGRGGRVASVCGPPCVCVMEGSGVLLVDCSMVQASQAVVQGFVAAPPSPPPRKDSIIRLVIMSSELPGLYDDSFGNVSFTHVHVKYNHGLGHVAEHAFRASRMSLRVLDLRNNNFTIFPLPNLKSFSQLQFLSVDDNGMSVMPGSVSGLASLVHLSASNNRIHILEPSALTSLPSLQFLDLHSNRLAYLPVQLAFLPALRSLVLWGNPITTLPQEFYISHLTNLHYLPDEDLACDCSIKWLVTNTTLLHHVSGRCNDKNINLRFLDPDYFNIFCF